MKNIVIIILIVIASASVGWLFLKPEVQNSLPNIAVITKVPKATTATETALTSVVATNLDTPWALAFLPDGSMLITERAGRVRLIDSSGSLQVSPVATISNVVEVGEGGLLGIAIHPQFATNSYVYFYYTYTSTNNNTLNRVVRMTYKDNQLTDEVIVVDKIPGASNHNGGRIKFGPDNYLYIGTGDAQQPSEAQNVSSLAGKILRVTDEGKPAPGNPFNSAVYSYGHRNVQGLTWDDKRSLWATEHGRSGLQSGLDELNLIEPGKNYGWPTIQGNQTKEAMVTARLNSGSTTWAPSGAAFYKGSVFFSGLRGRALYQASIADGEITLNSHFSEEFGRIREVVLSSDGMIYISTSNNDERGDPIDTDDRIIKINAEKLPL